MSRAALFNPSRRHLLPEGLPTPEAVAEPAERARIAFSLRERVGAEARELRKQIERAAHQDRLADRQATEAGRPLPKPRAPALRDELATAERRAEAALGALRGALGDQAAAISAARDGWLAELQSAMDDRRRDLLGRLEAIGAELIDLEDERRLADALRSFTGHPQSLDVQLHRPDYEERARVKAREHVERGRAPKIDRADLLAMLAGMVERTATPPAPPAPARKLPSDDERFPNQYPRGMTVGGS